VAKEGKKGKKWWKVNAGKGNEKRMKVVRSGGT